MLRAGHVYNKKTLQTSHEIKISQYCYTKIIARFFFGWLLITFVKLIQLNTAGVQYDYFVPEILIFNVTIIIFYKHMATLSKPLCA